MSQQITQEALQKLQTDYFGQFILDNAKFLEEMYHKLKGETLTEEVKTIDGDKVLVPVWSNSLNIVPMLNQRGLDATMNVLNLSLTINNATGNMEDDVLRTLAFKTYILLVKDYRGNMDRYGFKNENDIYMLAHLIFTNIFLHLSKSTGMALLKELFSSYFIQETRGVQNKKQDQEVNVTI